MLLIFMMRIDIDSVVQIIFSDHTRLPAVGNGHRDIAFIGDIYTSSIQDRFLWYYKALLENRTDCRAVYNQ